MQLANSMRAWNNVSSAVPDLRRKATDGRSYGRREQGTCNVQERPRAVIPSARGVPSRRTDCLAQSVSGGLQNRKCQTGHARQAVVWRADDD